jgi:hypothetical protein
MPRLILIAAAALAFYIAITRIKALPVTQRRGAYVQLALVVAAITTVILALMGKMHWIGALLTGVLVMLRQSLPLLIQLLPHLKGWLGQQAHGQSSQVETKILRMTLDHNTGKLDGLVLMGDFEGRELHSLGRPELEELLLYCNDNDTDSAQLLANYMEQRFNESFSSNERNQSSSAELSKREALAILGLSEGASRDEIIAAHRKLMQKLHPDRGGNDYLASRVNAAKALLLED